MKLSEHFKLEEFTRSYTALVEHINNSASTEIIVNLTHVAIRILEPLRAFANTPQGRPSLWLSPSHEVPITISSGYRCPALNKAVGGADKSQHMKGEAVDIHLPSIETGRKWLTFILENLRFDQLIWEHDTHGTYWIHVSLCINDADNRQKYIPNMVKAEKKV